MSKDWLSSRTIIESEEASTSLLRLGKEFERFDDQWIGFSWFLCRSPEKSRHKELNGLEYRLMHRAGDSKFSLVGIAAVYTYDENCVSLIDVQAWEEGDD